MKKAMAALAVILLGVVVSGQGGGPSPEQQAALAKQDALEKTRYKQKEAAALLGLTYDQFRQRYRKYSLGKD